MNYNHLSPYCQLSNEPSFNNTAKFHYLSEYDTAKEISYLKFQNPYLVEFPHFKYLDPYWLASMCNERLLAELAVFRGYAQVKAKEKILLFTADILAFCAMHEYKPYYMTAEMFANRNIDPLDGKPFMSRRAVDRYLKELEAIGLITIKRHYFRKKKRKMMVVRSNTAKMNELGISTRGMVSGILGSQRDLPSVRALQAKLQRRILVAKCGTADLTFIPFSSQRNNVGQSIIEVIYKENISTNFQLPGLVQTAARGEEDDFYHSGEEYWSKSPGFDGARTEFKGVYRGSSAGSMGNYHKSCGDAVKISGVGLMFNDKKREDWVNDGCRKYGLSYEVSRRHLHDFIELNSKRGTTSNDWRRMWHTFLEMRLEKGFDASYTACYDGKAHEQELAKEKQEERRHFYKDKRVFAGCMTKGTAVKPYQMDEESQALLAISRGELFGSEMRALGKMLPGLVPKRAPLKAQELKDDPNASLLEQLRKENFELKRLIEENKHMQEQPYKKRSFTTEKKSVYVNAYGVNPERHEKNIMQAVNKPSPTPQIAISVEERKARGIPLTPVEQMQLEINKRVADAVEASKERPLCLAYKDE